jgi:tRNA threonylcarbamoyladenosine biosynthesis protein TsaE
MQPETKAEAIVFNRVTLTDLPAVAKELIKVMALKRVCILQGDMGAGKTTLVKAIGNILAVEDTMSSPTFSIVNEYHTAASGPIFHFDFYRIRSEADAFEVGTEEYFYSGAYCFVEWAEKIPSLLPDSYAQVNLISEDDTHRTIEILLHG